MGHRGLLGWHARSGGAFTLGAAFADVRGGRQGLGGRSAGDAGGGRGGGRRGGGGGRGAGAGVLAARSQKNFSLLVSAQIERAPTLLRGASPAAIRTPDPGEFTLGPRRDCGLESAIVETERRRVGKSMEEGVGKTPVLSSVRRACVQSPGGDGDTGETPLRIL